jgi:hypothetical protein
MPQAITQKRFVSEALEAHNACRKRHNAPPLQHDPELSSLAREWAEHLAETGQLVYRNVHHKKIALGENILRASGFYLSGLLFFVFFSEHLFSKKHRPRFIIYVI